MIQIPPFSLSEINDAARQVIQACKPYKIWLFEGQMGAGKTTLIREICRQLGVTNNVQSPTFSIVNEYVATDGDTIYHFDCYRLKDTIEALDIGVEEYLDSGNLCLIEWYQKIASLLPTTCAHISIVEVENQQRKITISEE